MKRSLSFLATLVLLVGAGHASAYVVNIDFDLHGDHPGGATTVLYSGTAKAPDSGTTWNELQVLDDNTFEGAPGEFGFWKNNAAKSNLLNSQGVATSVGVTAVAANDTGAFGMLQGSPNLGCAATDAVNLMRDYLIALNGTTQHVVLDGLTPGSPVDLYLYGAGDTDNRDTIFSITDVNGLHSTTTTGTISPDGNNPVSHVLTLGGDYNVLTGILPDVSGHIDISYTHAGGSAEGPFNGLQIVSAVPEPTSFALLGIGGLALAVVRRMRSK